MYMITMTKDKIDNYMKTIFSEKKLVDLNFGRTDIIRIKIPKNIIPNQEFSFNQLQ